MYKITAIVLISAASIMSASFTVTIGKQSFSAKITVDNGDTSNRTKYDSLCPSYRYIQSHGLNMGAYVYDYKITVIRTMSGNGFLCLFSPFSPYFNSGKDTLNCDSLGFQPPRLNSYSSFTDTIKTDTSIYFWIYPRPVKKTIASISQKQIYGFSNHLKVFLRTSTFSDSLIVTREKIIFGQIQSNGHSVDNSYFKPSIQNIDRGDCVYNLKGIKVSTVKINAVLLIQDKRQNMLYKNISYK